MTVLSSCKFSSHVIICDPVYIVKDVIDYSSKPNIDQYVPVECTNDMLRDSQISMLYKYGMEDYYYDLNKWQKTAQSDWDICDYGRSLSRIGFSKFCVSDLGYGYGSYAVYEANTKSFMGQFCSDTGVIAVMDLEEVLSYDESFDKFNTMPWAVCFIPNYSGNISIINKNDKAGVEADISIVGSGNMKFYSKQVGF